WRWWTSWPGPTTTPSTPPEQICFGGWAATARPRPPTSAQPPWRRPTPSETSSGSVAEPRAEPTGDVEQVAGPGFHLVARACDGAELVHCAPPDFLAWTLRGQATWLVRDVDLYLTAAAGSRLAAAADGLGVLPGLAEGGPPRG